MRRLKLLVVLVCLSWVCSAYSNESDRFFNRYNFHFITERFGLPYSVVTDIIQDSDGYIWAATYNGLARYDGYQFLNYNSQTHPIRLKTDLYITYVKTNSSVCGLPRKEVSI